VLRVTSPPPLNVLFLCTGNSARSILAEAILTNLSIGQGQFTGYSAGSQPRGAIHPLALETLEGQHLPVEGFRSKSWEEFARPGAPRMDFVFAVCDQAAAEVCPVWPGQPMTAHWGIPDPAAIQSTDEERRRAFREAFVTLRRRIELFASLPLDKLRGLALKERLDEIGRR
jgi:arsenate reductase (thioredoxin)